MQNVVPDTSTMSSVMLRTNSSKDELAVRSSALEVIGGGELQKKVEQSPQQTSVTRATALRLCRTVASDGSGGDVACVPIVSETARTQQPSRLLAEKYLLLNPVEGSQLYSCINVHTHEELVCKIVSRENSAALLSAHYRLDEQRHVAPLREVLAGERLLYLVFSRSHGDLHAYVRARRRLRETEARRLFRQIAATVHACHAHGIVLRDLKLRKFVFSDTHRSELKLESLEDAVVLDDPDNDILHDKRGCPAYVSPEILRAGANYSGKAADMWSLGVILYTMLVGRYPFNDSEHTSLFAKISRGHFVIPECLSSRAKCLIRALLRREPSERICSEDVLLHPWLNREDRDSHSRSSDQLVPEMSFDD